MLAGLCVHLSICHCEGFEFWPQNVTTFLELEENFLFLQRSLTGLDLVLWLRFGFSIYQMANLTVSVRK